MIGLILNLIFIYSLVLAESNDELSFKDQCVQKGNVYCEFNKKCYMPPSSIQNGGRPEAIKYCENVKFKGAESSLPEVEEEEDLKKLVTQCLNNDGKFFLQNDERCEVFAIQDFEYVGRISLPLEDCVGEEVQDVQVICEIEENNILENIIDSITGIF